MDGPQHSRVGTLAVPREGQDAARHAEFVVRQPVFAHRLWGRLEAPAFEPEGLQRVLLAPHEGANIAVGLMPNDRRAVNMECAELIGLQDRRVTLRGPFSHVVAVGEIELAVLAAAKNIALDGPTRPGPLKEDRPA